MIMVIIIGWKIVIVLAVLVNVFPPLVGDMVN